MFFQPKPSVPDTVKARIEFYYQQIADCIGLDRLTRPVMSLASVEERMGRDATPKTMIQVVGEHLSFDTTGLQWIREPKQSAACGSGGG